ncbi:MAG: glutamate-1-semialdehyde 2,1-aminomutase [Planctomycetota bacterium]|jgi:glutamate-1-semialdehyde 2,1-aminomutase|nr:glutamate-1-semialdehyde 2,1-aminomutase [Planctomycetota bacterium]
MKTEKSRALFARAGRLLPGGVNSPVRAFRSVNLEPRFIAAASRAELRDADGNVYLDYVGSWGPMILGHADPDIGEAVIQTVRNGLSFGAPCELEVRLAETIVRLARVEMIRMVNSGTEAVMAAIRLARGFTGRDKIVKFSGCYHGHADSMLIQAGSGALTAGVPDSAGVTRGAVADTLSASYNDLAGVEDIFAAHPGGIAAVIVEPVAANMGVVPPRPGFLQGLRRLCRQYGALLIFDEVITGFRLGLGGAQEFFGVQADLAAYGKIIGGGLPVGAYGGRRDIMRLVAPLGPVYQAGTLSGNPAAMAAGLAQLEKLERNPDIYPRIGEMAAQLAGDLGLAAEQAGLPARVNQIGSLCSLFFTDSEVVDFASAQKADAGRFARFFGEMLERGIYIAPSQFEAMFIGASHTREDIIRTAAAAAESLKAIR